MRFPSDADLAAMRANGLDPASMAEQIRRHRRGQMAHSIKQDIHSAFAGVRLGDGIGLFEAQGIDDYADPATCAQFRKGDEKDDWTAIAVEDLNRCYSSLSFFDAAGMRFHLPAYLIADLDGAYLQDLDFTLTMTSRMDEQFALLDPAQRAAVRHYLEFIADDPEGRFGREQILLALSGYWAT